MSPAAADPARPGPDQQARAHEYQSSTSRLGAEEGSESSEFPDQAMTEPARFLPPGGQLPPGTIELPGGDIFANGVDQGAPQGSPLKATGQRARIGDIARLLGVSSRSLRYYEGVGLIHPVRDGSNWRTYGEPERVRLQTIVFLRAAGMSLKAVASVLSALEGGPGGRVALRLLRDRRTALAAEVRRLAELERQIASLPGR